jgi:molybdopterin molybdotransferase
MTEFFTVLSPADALTKLWEHLSFAPRAETIPTTQALGRVTFEALTAPAPLPAFPRSTMDGYAVRAQDTFGASASLPAYLTVIGEVPMGQAPTIELQPAQAALIHTGGSLPSGANAVVQIENTQKLALPHGGASRNKAEGVGATEIEVVKPVGVGENIVKVGEDVAEGEGVLPAGHRLRAQDLGGLLALGITSIRVAARPRVALLATGDEIVSPETEPGPGQIRDINSYTVAGLVTGAGGVPVLHGIVRDNFDALRASAARALAEADALILSAGSSISVRDMTAEVINDLGRPGALVHGVAVKPGKPTILAVAEGKPIFGLPGNPVSAFVIADLFVAPTLYRMQGGAAHSMPRRASLQARLTHNVASAPGREDYLPAKLIEREDELWAEPVFGKSNLIYTLIHADGLLKIPMDANGVSEGERVEVTLF